MRGDALEPGEFYSLLRGWWSPMHVSLLIDACKKHLSEGWDLCNKYLWNRILEWFVQSCYASTNTMDDVDRGIMNVLANLTRRAISDGLDIHCDLVIPYQPDYRMEPALQRLFKFCRDEDETLFCCHHWTEMLHQAGVDVDIYLEREIRTIEASWNPHLWGSAYLRELKVENYMGRNLPIWFKSFTATAAPELFSEFPHLASWDSCGNIIPGRHTPGDIYRMADGPKPHQGWKQVLQVGGGIVHPPLERWSLNWHRPPRPLDEEGKKMVEGLAYACDLMESRFERKRLKKLRKAGYMREFAPLRFKERIPGTWVE